MNATICRITDLDLDVCYDFAIVDNDYDTAPMVAVVPSPQPVDEETLYSSFEEALTDRITGSHRNWYHLSDGNLNSVPVNYETDEFLTVAPATEPIALVDETSVSMPIWLRNLVCTCLALIFLLIGFDMMGLLELSIHH
ncbi:hypothetical protein KDW_23370 [Dictyobacter vulcani]|uniref:Uncharacterized protein n=1 Tax=Dictyobacter vulcani TaxID=2607529 RepID=A0A5J4KK27_9CHLR|nr:hypothetical protein [Dictyobacter vulcani]GER88175.1 hypothetical protein KDW_23370 [Dictyobacter vulcani]